MIRYIVETISSKTDRNGNRYHFARVTSTLSGNSLVIDHVGDESNAASLVRRLTGADWSEVHRTESTLGLRDWSRANKAAVNNEPLYEHQITTEMLEGLNK